MLLSRFWYVILAVALGVAAGGLFVAQTVYNRAGREAMEQALRADAQVVKWYLNDDARRRSSLLLKVCLDETIRKELHKASSNDGKTVPDDVKRQTRGALEKLVGEMPDEYRFSSLLAIDQTGRVVGQVGFDQAAGIENFDMGGYAIVADALRGWVRDDAWVLDGRIYLVVARPVEVDTAQVPAGAVVGLRIVDTAYAKQLSKRFGVTVGFFAGGTVNAKASPESADASKLDTIVMDLKYLADDPGFQEKGTSKPKILLDDIGVIYSKIPGEAWDLGAGYVVGRLAPVVKGPFALGLLEHADADERNSAPWWLVVAIVVGGSLFGLIPTIFEHTRPLRILEREASRLAKGETDMLQVSKFRGLYRKIARDLNDGAERIAAKGGLPRRAADLESVLGPIPAQPEMKAFAFADDTSAAKPIGPPRPPSPSQISLPKPPSMTDDKPVMPAPKPLVAPKPEPQKATEAVRPLEASGSKPVFVPPPAPHPGTNAASDEADEMAEWRLAFEQFLQTKKECGEPTGGLTFEKFQVTLRKNQQQLVSKTNCARVKFTVYVKDGRAALKASPVR